MTDMISLGAHYHHKGTREDRAVAVSCSCDEMRRSDDTSPVPGAPGALTSACRIASCAIASCACKGDARDATDAFEEP